MEKYSKVALVKCTSYNQQEVDSAVRQAVRLLGGFGNIFMGTSEESFEGGDPSNGKTLDSDSLLVLKPNLLAKAAPERACTTHPAVFRAVGRALQDEGYSNLKYGDSPGNPVIKPEKVADECGIKGAADELRIPIGNFEKGIEVNYPRGAVADRFILCDEIVRADGIINICKMKTHQLERITGAVKNTFGCVYGANKAASHAKYPTAETFAKMMADLNCLVKPVLHVMDGVVAMEGNGPQSGTPTPMNVILASTDPVALDSVFCYLVDLKPELVPTNYYGQKQGIGTCENIEIVTADGEITPEQAAELYGSRSFNVQRSREFRGALKPVRFLAPLLEKKPVVKKERCIGCGMCVNACPVDGKAVFLKTENSHERQVPGDNSDDIMTRRIAEYDYGKCIKCYCCQEMCPEEALTVKKPLLARIADRNWRI